MDIDDIDPGEDFSRRIDHALGACQVALVLIGPRWLTAQLPDGTRRIDVADDFCRQELSAALAHPGVTVIPVLIESASMPSSAELPEAISALTRLNAFELSNRHWDYDVAQLAGFIDRYDNRWKRLRHRSPRVLLRAAPIVALAIAAAVVGILSGGGRGAGASGGGEDAAQRVAACERSHGLSASQVVRPPQPGEARFKRSSVTFTGIGRLFMQNTYASCGWPPPAGADPDGYRAITVTLTNGPGKDDASGRDFADVIESQCDRLHLTYNEALMGVQTQWQPFTAAPGDVWAPVSSVNATRFVKVGQIGAPSEQGLELPFYPQTSDVVVLHGQQQLQNPQCLG